MFKLDSDLKSARAFNKLGIVVRVNEEEEDIIGEGCDLTYCTIHWNLISTLTAKLLRNSSRDNT